MGFRIENNCVGPCPMGCIHCSHDYRQHYCDRCGIDEDDENEPLYDWFGKELCYDCVKSLLVSKVLDDMDDSRCEECSCEADELFQLDGRWLCEECLKEYLDSDYRIYREEN